MPAGVPDIVLPDGTSWPASMAASFYLTVPDLAINKMQASITVASAAAVIPVTVSTYLLRTSPCSGMRQQAHQAGKLLHVLRTSCWSCNVHILSPRLDQSAQKWCCSQVLGDVPLFDGACTASSFVLLFDTAAATYSATMTLTCPDLNINAVSATLSYAAGVVRASVHGGSITFLDGKVVVDQLSLSTTTSASYIQGDCGGQIAGYSCSVGFNISKAAVGLKRKVGISVGVPSVNFGGLLSGLMESTGVQLPSNLLDFTFPSITISTPDVSLGGSR